MENDIYNLIGKNIKKQRMKKGLKQRDLASLLYMSDSFIAKLESKTRQTISIDTLEQIANILGVDIREFLIKKTNEEIVNYNLFFKYLFSCS